MAQIFQSSVLNLLKKNSTLDDLKERNKENIKPLPEAKTPTRSPIQSFLSPSHNGSPSTFRSPLLNQSVATQLATFQHSFNDINQKLNGIKSKPKKKKVTFGANAESALQQVEEAMKEAMRECIGDCLEEFRQLEFPKYWYDLIKVSELMEMIFLTSEEKGGKALETNNGLQ